MKVECDKLFHLKRNGILKVSSVKINVHREPFGSSILVAETRDRHQ